VKYLLIGLKVFIISVAFFFASLQQTLATMSLNFTPSSDNINYTQEFDVDMSLSGAPKNTIYYLQIAFTQSANPAYFGFTQGNDDTWHKYGESFDSFFKITTNEEGSWSGKMRGKPDSEDKDFKGSGSYILKIGRFTSSGASHYWSDNNTTVYIQAPSFTPTSIPEPTPSPTSKPSNKPTPSPTSKPQNSPTPTPKLTIAVSDKKSREEATIIVADVESDSILGESDIQSTDEGKISKKSGVSLPVLVVLLSGGVICVGAAVFLSIKKIKREHRTI